VNKKIKPNRYKPVAGQHSDAMPDSSGRVIDICLRCIMTIALISILSLGYIFAYDFITQSPCFNIRKIDISGTTRVSRQEILKLAGLDSPENIFRLNIFLAAKHIATHPWVQSAVLKRHLPDRVSISVTEEKPLAVVRVENIADILINTQGKPFKEYNPRKDKIGNLPVISGIDLTFTNDQYQFDSPLFNCIMKFLNLKLKNHIRQIKGNTRTGISVVADHMFGRQSSLEPDRTILLSLGFGNFRAKLLKARQIAEYMDTNFPGRTICAMDLSDIKKAFIKTQTRTDALHNNLKKGV
jgi:cell division protein FtsQ